MHAANSKGFVASPYVVVLSLIGVEAFAQATMSDAAGWVQVLVNLGVAGYMLWWFSTRMERLLEGMRRALDRSNRARMLELSVHRLASQELREDARAIIAEVDEENPNTPR